MIISILLTLLLTVISLGGLILQEGKICLIDARQKDLFSSINNNLKRNLNPWAVKLVMRGLGLLNTVMTAGVQKADQTTIIYTDIHIFWG